MITLEDLLKSGAHIGHKKSKWNPKMAPFVFGVRNDLHIIDVTKTLDKLNQAMGFLRELVKGGGVILWVGARIQSRDLIKETAEELGMPYVTGRWIGGLFTNFKIIRERLKYFLSLEERFAKGEMSKYTKKEQLNFGRQLAKLRQEMGGIRNLQNLPQAIFVTDVGDELDAVREAKKMGIKVAAVVDTSSDPSLVDYIIPANNDSVDALRLIVGGIREELQNMRPTASQQ